MITDLAIAEQPHIEVREEDVTRFLLVYYNLQMLALLDEDPDYYSGLIVRVDGQQTETASVTVVEERLLMVEVVDLDNEVGIVFCLEHTEEGAWLHVGGMVRVTEHDAVRPRHPREVIRLVSRILGES